MKRETALDGRVERTAATRRNILAMTRELILEGRVDPTAKEIADRAGITTRTLFRHFADMEALHRSFIEDVDTQASGVMDEPFPEDPDSDWEALLDVLVDRRVRVYEFMLPLYVSAMWSRHRSTMNPAGVERRRQRLRNVLPDSLRADPLLFEALDGVLSIEYWVSLRRDQKLSIKRAAAVMRLAAQKLSEN